MEINLKEKEETTEQYNTGDTIEVNFYDGHSEYYLIAKTFSDYYILVALACHATQPFFNNEFYDVGNLTVDGSTSAVINESTETVNELIKNLKNRSDAKSIRKINLTLVEE